MSTFYCMVAAPAPLCFARLANFLFFKNSLKINHLSLIDTCIFMEHERNHSYCTIYDCMYCICTGFDQSFIVTGGLLYLFKGIVSFFLGLLWRSIYFSQLFIDYFELGINLLSFFPPHLKFSFCIFCLLLWKFIKQLRNHNMLF